MTDTAETLTPDTSTRPARKWFDIASCCCGALGLGTGLVAVFIALLSLYGVSSADNDVPATIRSLTFPENAAALDSISAQLKRDGAALAGIEPAAGSKTAPAATAH